MRLALLAAAVPLLAAPLPAQAPPEWTKGATCYEIFVRSFADSDGDGIGDLNGLIARLDYVNDGDPRSTRDLGARCIWLMPVAESPSYHGYDVTDHYTVERDYGTNADFRRLVAEAHRRGIKVLVDMVLNHASSEHPHFKAALADPASPYRAWFRWSDTLRAERSPWGTPAWHRSPARDEHYYGVFWSGMPDLDYTHAPVREEAKKVARFWLEEMRVDGFRLDAIPFLVEEDGHVHHTRGTHEVLREYAAYARSIKPDVYLIGEVWDSTGAMLPYYPDQLDAHFSFEIADGILKAVREEDARGMLAPVVRLQRDVPAQRWSPFLRNHDQPRTRTELGGDVAKARLAATLMLTMPGVPFVYYGEEIGMTGTKPDERIRTPMQWTAGPNAGFTTGTPWQALGDDVQSANVAAQSGRRGSLLELHRRLIHLRAALPALATGELVPLETTDSTVVAFLRTDASRPVLVVANLGDAPATDVRVTSAGSVLDARPHRVRGLLGGRDGARLLPDRRRIVDYRPVMRIAPREALLFQLESDRPPRQTR